MLVNRSLFNLVLTALSTITLLLAFFLTPGTPSHPYERHKPTAVANGLRYKGSEHPSLPPKSGVLFAELHFAGLHFAGLHDTRSNAQISRSHTYKVRAGDTLVAISEHLWPGSPAWEPLWWANKAKVPDPCSISTGQVLTVPSRDTVPSWMHSKAVAACGQVSKTSAAPAHATPVHATPVAAAVAPAAPPHATSYSCSMLEQLWVSAGGSSATALMAADIAMAESGGNPSAISPTNDYGLWQINGSWGWRASLNPLTNAQSAVFISQDGSNWSPWSTYTSGAYAGRC